MPSTGAGSIHPICFQAVAQLGLMTEMRRIADQQLWAGCSQMAKASSADSPNAANRCLAGTSGNSAANDRIMLNLAEDEGLTYSAFPDRHQLMQLCETGGQSRHPLYGYI